MHLLNSAERDPDTALLAINSIQKALSASDPYLRALALKTMSSLRVPVIAQIVSLGIKRGAGDMSPMVRRAAALAIPKCWRLDPSTSPQLEEYLGTMLGDRQYYVAGAAVLAMSECWPDRIDLLHKHYRSLVRKLVDMDEWAQLATLRLLTYYARKCFPRRTKRVKKMKASNPDEQIKDFYEDDVKSNTAGQSAVGAEDEKDLEETEITDLDLTLLLKSAQPLLHSRSSAVVVAVVRLYLALTGPTPQKSDSRASNATEDTVPEPSTYLLSAIGPLISLLRAPPSIAHQILLNVLQVASLMPQYFVQYTRKFLIHKSDSPAVAALKLEMLTLLFPHSTPHGQSLILSEIEHCCHAADDAPQTQQVRQSDPKQELSITAVQSIGPCAQSSAPDQPPAQRCLSLLLDLISSSSTRSLEDSSSNHNLTAEALTVLRLLIQADPASHLDTVIRLAKSLDTPAASNPQARASIVWLVGEFAPLSRQNQSANGDIAADVLRLLAKGFASESEEVKKQIIVLSAKVYLQYLNDMQENKKSSDSTPESKNDEDMGDSGPSLAPLRNPTDQSQGEQYEDISNEPIPLLFNYIHHLTRYDTSYTLRDLARVHGALLPEPSALSNSVTSMNTQLASLLLLAPKPVSHAPLPSSTRSKLTLGSASLAMTAEVDGGMETVGLKGYEGLPDWVKPGEEPDPKLRDFDDSGGRGGVLSASERLDAGTRSAASVSRAVNGDEEAATKGKGTTLEAKGLDDWLDDEGAEESEQEGSETDESSGTEEDEETEEEEESEDEGDERSTLVK